MSKLPNFIIIGAGKCGTTSLFHYLSQHPNIYMCPKKETFFFLNESSRAKNKKWGAVENLEEYQELFKDAPKNAIIGEISTTYYSDPTSAQSIHSILPDTKIIAILRDPANRAFSDYLMHYNINKQQQSFESLIYESNYFVKLGFYYSQLVHYFKAFDSKNIKILFYEDLLNNSEEFIKDLFTFLEVEPNIKVDMAKRYRNNGIPKNKILYTLFIKPGKAQNITKRLLEILPKPFGNNLYTKIKAVSVYKPTLSSDDRAKLIEIYRPEILRLQGLIDKDLSKWLTV
ncbi:sulfotransferase [Chroococcus sp. FPU101]|uniref:sulfotransferase family protein n=1 Tax=Chroococcus sp. FPU101 TaxID=1974212 RepID=UPI001A8D44A7|nr:sulfotransferase [Chroococcus sp. FPU101]GFE70505.1 sulfotransferase [Chroococcus sp. FPU101]